MRRDCGYRRNGTRRFGQTLCVTRAPADAKVLAYTAEKIGERRASPVNSRPSPTCG